MNSTNSETPSAELPVSRGLNVAYVFSILVAFLMAAASLAGLLYPDHLYPTEALRQSFVANDVVNLVLGLPSLLASMFLARRGRLLGLLFWPGALLYVLYNYLAYTFALPLNIEFLLSVVLLALSAYTMIGLVASLDGSAVRQRLSGAVPERIAGGVLVGLGALFSLRVIAALAQALLNHMPVADVERALHVADLLVCPAWVLGGLLLWRREPLGYVTGLGLLFQGSMLFIGLVAVLLLQPLMTSALLAPVDIIVVLAMGLVCFVPFALFLRGVAARA